MAHPELVLVYEEVNDVWTDVTDFLGKPAPGGHCNAPFVDSTMFTYLH